MLRVQKIAAVAVLGSGLLASCAPPEPRTVKQEELQRAVVMPAVPVLKRKVAVGRFTNSSPYGKLLLAPEQAEAVARQAADMLSARLIETGAFLVMERPDIDLIAEERGRQDLAPAGFVGVDSMVVGSVTEFGRKVEGKAGFLNSTKRQVATATVEARLIDVHTGLAFFSGTGTGTAASEAGEVAGFGARAGYDATLNDRAISLAVSDLMTDILNRLDERPWSTDIIHRKADTVMISGGRRQGLAIGDVFAVQRRGEVIKSAQTGFDIELPGETIAQVKVIAFFGADEFSEGATCRIVQGEIPEAIDLNMLKVVEIGNE